jgi:hypothetical protein
MAERHEFRVALDIGDQIEHLLRAVGYTAFAGKSWHYFLAPARTASLAPIFGRPMPSRSRLNAR